jgi:hypothetical protein
MSRNNNPYLFYTQYYLISGAYQVINVVNGILTYSASYSDNIKEYLRNQVASKQVALNELIRNRSENDARVNGNANPDNDLDEDGFVVIKMRKPRTKIINITNEELLSKMKTENENNNVKDHAIDYAIIKDIIEEMMSRF